MAHTYRLSCISLCSSILQLLNRVKSFGGHSVSVERRVAKLALLCYFAGVSPSQSPEGYWIHTCQLSRIIRESPGYRTNLSVSRTGNQISRIKATSVPNVPKSKQFRSFLKSPRRFLRHFFRLSNLLTTKPRVEGN